ncbi:TSC complex subunit 1a isoform 2-T3 [Pholidichthys leucotaenia]
MSREQLTIAELLLSLDSSELQEAEQVRAAVNQQLTTDRGGAVLSSLVDHYLDSLSPQAVVLLSSIREPLHKTLLDKLTESLSRPGSRLSSLTLLGHLIRNQPPWVHHISHSPLLPSLLRCLKTDGHVVVLITGVLVLITLLPMIPQAAKQHIYDFFDVFGRLASWSYRNPGQVPVVQLVHLHAAVYSLFHRLYGMFPCNFVSYLRLHYSMKENLDTFQEVIKPMLDQVRVHPELITGTQDSELEPSRWRCYEVHDIVIECSRVSLDPLESSSEEDTSSSSLRRPHLDVTMETLSSSGSLGFPSLWGHPPQLDVSASFLQETHLGVQEDSDVTWSPSSQCGLSTPPEPAATGPASSTSRCSSISGVKVPVISLTEDNQMRSHIQHQPITEQQVGGLSDVINNASPEEPRPLTSTPSSDSSKLRPFISTPSQEETPSSSSGSSLFGPAPPYEPLFDLALPQATVLFISRKSQEVVKGAGLQEKDDGEKERSTVTASPLKVLDQLILHGQEVHQHLSRRWSAVNKALERSQSGGPALEEELQSLKSQLLLVQGQLQYERFKRQQHAIRNRRLLRRVINATVLEEHSVAMKAQLDFQENEIRSLKASLEEEQRRYCDLQQETQTNNEQLQTHVKQLLLQRENEQKEHLRTQSELRECCDKLRDLEAELQRANSKAENAEHQLTQLSIKLCSSEQLQQQVFLMNQQLVLLRETNRTLREQLEGGGTTRWFEDAMLRCTVGKEFQRLKDGDVQLRQKLEAANQRTADLEMLLTKRDKLILDQKKLLEDTKTKNRAELAASDNRCGTLRRLVQMLQTEMLHLYGQTHLDGQTHLGIHTHSRPHDISRSGSGDLHHRPPCSSAVGVMNGVEALSSSPLSPIDSPLTVGSFLERRARQLFTPPKQSQEEEQEEEEEEQQQHQEEEEVQPESPPLGLEVEEATLLAGSPQREPPSCTMVPSVPPADLTAAVRQRRDELSIMDYNETLPDM